MYKFAKSHSKKMAKAGRLFHSRRFALRGGENISGGKGHHSPKDFIRNWMGSPPHRAWLLDPRVKTAAVGISKSKHGTFAAWSFSDQPLRKPFKIPFKFRVKVKRGIGGGILRLPVKIILILAAIFAIVLGAHGVYVYFSPLELLFGGGADKLFLALEMPAGLRDPIEWMSWKGFESWFIPAVFIFIGLSIWYLQSRIRVGRVSRWLRKLHLW